MARFCDVVGTCTKAGVWRRKLDRPETLRTTECACDDHRHLRADGWELMHPEPVEPEEPKL